MCVPCKLTHIDLCISDATLSVSHRVSLCNKVTSLSLSTNKKSVNSFQLTQYEQSSGLG